MTMFNKYLFFTLISLLFISFNSCHSESTKVVYSKSYLLGKYQPSKQTNFSKISSKYTDKASIYLHNQAYKAFIDMYKAAGRDGIHLRIVSATRNFYSQKYIWESKWNGKRLVNGKNLERSIPDPVQRAGTILLYSSMPGTSRHHWGTDIDINNLNDSYFLSGRGKQEFVWLKKNANKYGFYQVYTPKPPRPRGYEEEKWHWTYLPLSAEMLRQYQEKITLEDIKGFQGSDTAFELDIINKYVMGINKRILSP